MGIHALLSLTNLAANQLLVIDKNRKYRDHQRRRGGS